MLKIRFKLRKVAVIISCLAVTTMISSCDEKEKEEEFDLVSDWFDGKITATMENVSAWSVSKIVARTRGKQNYIDVVSGNYSNGGFTLNLPSTLPDECLENTSLDFINFNFSDYEAKIQQIEFSYYENSNNNDFWLGTVWHYTKVNDTETSVLYWYADRDVTITGKDNTSKVSISFKKGWNRLYVTDNHTDGIFIYSTKPVDGCKWYFNQSGNSL